MKKRRKTDRDKQPKKTLSCTDQSNGNDSEGQQRKQTDEPPRHDMMTITTRTAPWAQGAPHHLQKLRGGERTTTQKQTTQQTTAATQQQQDILHTMLTNTMMMDNTYHAKPYNDDEQH